MGQSRSILGLLIILKENKKYFASGLCALIDILKTKSIITGTEAVKLRNHLHLFHTRSRNLAVWELSVGYYWKACEWPPRLRWINQEIKKKQLNENN